MPVNFKRRRIGGVASIYEVYDDPEVTAYAMQKGDLIIAIVAHGTFNSIIWVSRYVGYLP